MPGLCAGLSVWGLFFDVLIDVSDAKLSERLDNIMTARHYQLFVHREASLRISTDQFEAVTTEIVKQRQLLEEYIVIHPEFQTALSPVTLKPQAPLSARRMAEAASAVGTGPMAAVAGTMAQLAVEAAMRAGAREAIVENGGDIYMQAENPVVTGIYSGPDTKMRSLAFSIQPQDTPLAICASSGIMGHSMSLGRCELATVIARDGALADAAATQAANGVRSEADIQGVLDRIVAISGVDGILIIQNGQIGLAGKLPPLIRQD